MVKPTPPNERISPEGLYNVLCEAASQDPAKMQAASALLKDMLELPGCWNVLQEIAAQKTVPLPVRQLSALQFKNRALDHWRSRRCATVSCNSLPKEILILYGRNLDNSLMKREHASKCAA